MGQVFTSFSDELVGGRLGFVGLGTGALAAYGRTGQSMTFFEIDRATEKIARDPRLFRYLADSKAEVEVVLGDGRLSLQDESAGKFDLLVLDAFSSDAIPVHLLTKEAVELYQSRLRPRGLLLFHISNRHLDLAPVIANIARVTGLSGVRQFDPTFDADQGRLPSSWIVLTNDDDRLGRLASDPLWSDLREAGTSGRPWTDDFSHVLGALR